jgi:predicted peptidase
VAYTLPIVKHVSYSLAILLIIGLPAFSEVLDKVTTIDGIAVQYKVVLPEKYDPNKTYPGVLAFAGGGQSIDIVGSMVKTQFQGEAEKRGYIVVSPAAPNGDLFFMSGGEKIFPGFLTKILSDYKIEGRKFHIAGRSNGGISAFHIAALHPEYFVSITGFPGYLDELLPSRIQAVSEMCIYMHVGQFDSDWRENVRDQSEFFREEGMKVRFYLEDGQEHSIETLVGEGAARLFDHFEEARKGCAK